MNGSKSANKLSWLKGSLIALGVVVGITFVFGAGFFVGRQSASPLRLPLGLEHRGSLKGHGAIGAIQSIGDQRITIRLRDGTIQVVLVDNETRLEKNFQRVSLADFKIDDQVVVLGSPNADGEIKAHLVGIIPPTFRGLRSFPTPSD